MECNIYNRQDYGGYWRRIFANLFDGVFLAIALALINAASEDRMSVFIFGLLTFLAYMIVFKVYRGATPGYHILGIKIVSINGTDITLKQVIVRLLSSVFSGVALGLGFLCIAGDRNKQAWHDKAAGTYVVKAGASPIGTVKIPQARLIRVRLAAPLMVPGLIISAFVCFCIGGLLTIGYFQTTGNLTGKLNHKDPRVRSFAAMELGCKRDPRAVEPLIHALQDENRDVRNAAICALGELKDPRAIEPLIKAFATRDLSDAPLLAACSLGKIGEPAVESVIAALGDQDDQVQYAAAHALCFLKDPRAVDALITTLKDGDSFIRRSAAVALGYQKDLRAVGPLIELLEKDEGVDVRRYVARALAEITANNFGENPEEWRKWWEQSKESFLKQELPPKN